IGRSLHAVAGTGLLTGAVDWVAETRHIMITERPDVVVAIFVGNYPSPPMRDARGSVIVADSPAVFAAWQHTGELLSKVVRSFHAPMYWVRPPPIALPPLAHA